MDNASPIFSLLLLILSKAALAFLRPSASSLEETILPPNRDILEVSGVPGKADGPLQDFLLREAARLSPAPSLVPVAPWCSI